MESVHAVDFRSFSLRPAAGRMGVGGSLLFLFVGIVGLSPADCDCVPDKRSREDCDHDDRLNQRFDRIRHYWFPFRANRESYQRKGQNLRATGFLRGNADLYFAVRPAALKTLATLAGIVVERQMQPVIAGGIECNGRGCLACEGHARAAAGRPAFPLRGGRWKRSRCRVRETYSSATSPANPDCAAERPRTS